MVVAECSLEKARECSGKLLSGDEKVLLNIVVTKVEDIISAFNYKNEVKNVKYVTVRNIKNFSELPSLVGADISSEEGSGVFFESKYGDLSADTLRDITDRGYTCLVRTSGNHTELETPTLRDIYNLCSEVRNLRVIGGTLVELPGIRIGLSDAGRDKLGGIYKDTYDNFLCVDIADLDNLEVIKSKFSKKASSSEPNAPKPPKPPKAPKEPKEKKPSKKEIMQQKRKSALSAIGGISF